MKIENFIDDWISKRIKSLKSFYPSAVKTTEFTAEEVFAELMLRKEIVLKWEVICPNCSRTRMTWNTQNDWVEGELDECMFCSEEYDPTEHLQPVFYKVV